MKILFCSPHSLDLRLGVSKVLIELAREMDRLGWQCSLVADEDVCPDIHRYRQTVRGIAKLGQAMGPYLERRAGEFDVVEYDHRFLPFPRRRFNASTLMVARVPLLLHHAERIAVPAMGGARQRLRSLVGRPRRLLERKYELGRMNCTLRGADLINVSNEDDRTELARRKFDPARIAVIPHGLTRERLASFAAVQRVAPDTPRVAFVGTFDARKGGADFPEIVRRVVAAVPACKFRLLGSQYRGVDDVLRFFPPALHRSIEVHPRFEPGELPVLLSDCSLGVFPSYFEAFGFGVLEMLAASLPVIAYDAPGPPMMLPREYLVTRGDVQALASKLVALLKSPGDLASARQWAWRRAGDFQWESCARLTSEVYSENVNALRLQGRQLP
jgi:glycosyltransferase involved in cell wall biosynthesis